MAMQASRLEAVRIILLAAGLADRRPCLTLFLMRHAQSKCQRLHQSTPHRILQKNLFSLGSGAPASHRCLTMRWPIAFRGERYGWGFQ